MKPDKRRVLAFVVIGGVLFLLVICIPRCSRLKMEEPEFPLGGPVPNSAIVFMPDANPEQVSRESESKTLGFIDADGNHRREYTFRIFGGAPSMFGMPLSSQIAQFPQWSASGEEIAFTIRNTAPNMRLIDKSGRMYGEHCTDIGTGTITFDLHDNVLIGIESDEDSLNTLRTSLVARYNIKTCQVVSVFSVPIPFEISISEIQEAENKLLVASFWDTEEQAYKILVYDANTKGVQILLGYHPSLTKDGTMLAYYDRYGWLIVRDMATDEEKRLIPVMPPSSVDSFRSLGMPGWSPDNQWLVYNTPEGEIFKVCVETGENVYLTHGWAPDWR